MLSLYVLSKYNIKPSSKILFQWINISVRLCSSSSSASSSSDSSDSDSDTEKTKSKHVESTSSASTTSDNKYDLESFVNNTIQARKLQKTIDVAMYLKKKSKDKTNNKYVPFEKKIINAAEDVANTLGGDKTKTTSDLLEKVLASRVEALRTEQARIFQEIDLWNGKSTIIFENLNTAPLNIPELKTWAALEQRELKALTTHPPANIFQELILWTEQGKLWKFPIDNEQGIEEEHSVHFSEHIFMERHLKEWCPKSGPIRHFMELVCIGLSKNPYLTVQEKIAHIMWYKEYFKSKQDILQETGAIQEPFPDTVKEISE